MAIICTINNLHSPKRMRIMDTGHRGQHVLQVDQHTFADRLLAAASEGIRVLDHRNPWMVLANLFATFLLLNRLEFLGIVNAEEFLGK